MPEFSPGESKVAKVAMTNPTGKAFDYIGVIYMGTDLAVMAEVSFHLNPGEEKQVTFPITMPSVQGSYPVHIGVFSGGQNIALYKAIEDVIIAVAVQPVPCVYCGATFTTEAGLIGHMQSKHPGKPYLVYAYPVVSQVASGAWFKINYKVYTPAVPGPENDVYFFTVYIPGFRVWEPYNGTQMYFLSGTPAGFYKGVSGMYTQYMVGQYNFYNIPPGTYHLFSMCRHCTVGPGGWTANVVRTFWQGADTGLTIEVVEAPPPAPNVFISQVFVSPTTVNVGKPVKITVVVANTGEATGSLRVTTTVNGVAIDTRTVTRTPSLYAGYYLYFTPQEAGAYQVEADGVTASFTVY